jgi:hypothetical protein
MAGRSPNGTARKPGANGPKEADDGGGAAVEVALRDDDLGAITGDALDPVAPAARGLDRSLDRFGAGIHGQHRIEAGAVADFGEKRPEPVAVVGTRRHGQAARLGFERSKQARMGVAVARRRISAHHVDVAPAFDVPQMGALAARQHHRQRLVIVSRVALLELDRRLGPCHGSPRPVAGTRGMSRPIYGT